MAHMAEHVVDLLNDIVATCHDREKGYEIARDGVRDLELKRLFEQYAEESRRGRLELERIIREEGGQPRAGGSLAGAAFHSWMDLKAAITRGDEAAVLAECERGEDAALRSYKRALGAGLSPELDALIARQSALVEQAHGRIRSLRDAARSSPSR